MIILRNGTGAIGIAITLPTGKTGSINWGDGNTTALTASGAAVNYYHTWGSWQTSSDSLEEYNIITITGDVTAISAIASNITAPRYWQTVLWIAAKSTTLTGLTLSASNIYAYNLVRLDLDTVNLLLRDSVFYPFNSLKTFVYNGGYTTGNGASTFGNTAIDTVSYTNTAATVVAGIVSGSRCKTVEITVSTTAAVNCSNLAANAPTLRRLSINAAWGSFASAFFGCYCLKEIDLSNCPVNGITDFSGNTGMYSLTKLLFPSTGTGVNRVPKAFAAGITSMGAIDISNSGLSRAALVDMFYSLPTNASARNLTITGSVGAADLTAEEITIATNKNWVVIR